MHDAEAVGDEDVGQGGELSGEGLALGVILGGLGGVEAHVLQQDDLTVACCGDGCLGGLAHGVLSESHLDTGDLGEALGDGSQGVVGVDLPLGAPQVGGDDHLGAGVEQGAQGGQSGLDAAVVGDVLVGVQRHVEVGADQDSLALEVAQGLDGLHEASHRLWVKVWVWDGRRPRTHSVARAPSSRESCSRSGLRRAWSRPGRSGGPGRWSSPTRCRTRRGP